MATFPFNPTATTPFQFQPTLDGAEYTAIVTWNVFGRRWYLTINQLDGTRVLTRAMVGSPNDYDINLVGGYFSSVLVYREASNQFEVSP